MVVLFVTPHVAAQLASPISQSPRPNDAVHKRLLHREHQAFRLLTAGRSEGEVAARLSLSSNTVSPCRVRILEKTGMHNDEELALYLVRKA